MNEKISLARAMRTQILQQQEIERAAPSVKGIYQRAYDGKASPRGAIKAMCLRCNGDERKEITACTCYECPLWRYRPYQADQEETSDEPQTVQEQIADKSAQE